MARGDVPNGTSQEAKDRGRQKAPFFVFSQALSHLSPYYYRANNLLPNS